MKRFVLIILVFAMALAACMGVVVWRTYQGLARQETERMRFFSDTIFDAMEAHMVAIIQREETRAVDEYHFTYTTPGDPTESQARSPLSGPPAEEFILGYLQNNPDGSFQTPVIENPKRIKKDQMALYQQLTDINRAFNRKKSQPQPGQKKVLRTAEKLQKKQSETGFADAFVHMPQLQESKAYLEKRVQRTEKITARQAINVLRSKASVSGYTEKKTAPATPAKAAAAKGRDAYGSSLRRAPAAAAREEMAFETRADKEAPMEKTVADDAEPPVGAGGRFQVEIAPLQSIFIDPKMVLVFRRVVINAQIYRQGFVLQVDEFMRHLAKSYYETQPMARFTQLQLQASDFGTHHHVYESGAEGGVPRFLQQRRFPAPFDFLQASILSQHIPGTDARLSMNLMVAVLVVVWLAGLVAIYLSVRSVNELARRRSQFVSTVTHELKTPLTNIRLYIEMLEQGIAKDTDREQEYLKILSSESSRLSRLIQNVLEMSRLEKRQRTFQWVQGDFAEVLQELSTVMAQTLRSRGYRLEIQRSKVPEFQYDREVMLQILINLLENSLKYGRDAEDKTIVISLAAMSNKIQLSVSDRGPGIPPRSLTKVFDDFYRVEASNVQHTRGTGIGLSLVKRFVRAMGGSVQASNNAGPGCTITLLLPIMPSKNRIHNPPS